MLHRETSREPSPSSFRGHDVKFPGYALSKETSKKKTDRPLKIDAAAMPLHWSVCWCSDSKVAVPLSFPFWTFRYRLRRIPHPPQAIASPQLRGLRVARWAMYPTGAPIDQATCN